MTWKLTNWAKTRMPLPGIPWRDMSDAEFAVASSRVPELEERGYFEALTPGPSPDAAGEGNNANVEPAEPAKPTRRKQR